MALFPTLNIINLEAQRWILRGVIIYAAAVILCLAIA